MSAVPPIIPTDRECLEAMRRADIEGFRQLVERYVALVYSAAYRRSQNGVHAEEVTKAVFLVLARRARRLPRRTVLATWLYHVTAIACRKLPRKFRPRRRRWFSFGRREPFPPEADLWTRMGPELDAAMDRLSPKRRIAVLVHVFLNHDPASTARILRINERRASERAASGLKKLSKTLLKRGIDADADTLAGALRVGDCAAPMAEDLGFGIGVRHGGDRLGEHGGDGQVDGQVHHRSMSPRGGRRARTARRRRPRRGRRLLA